MMESLDAKNLQESQSHQPPFLDDLSNELPSESSISDNDNYFSSTESGIDETEFRTNREESAQMFGKNADENTSISFEDLFNNLNVKRTARSTLLSRVEVDPGTKRLILKADRTNIRTRYGYDEGRVPYLYPEEALYLLDVGKLEIFCGHVSLSVQRARSLILVHKRKIGEDNLTNCTIEEYIVYKQLTRSNYCVFRCRHCVRSAPPTVDLSEEIIATPEHCEDTEMEEATDDIVQVEVNTRINCKRKRPLSCGSETDDDEIMGGIEESRDSETNSGDYFTPAEPSSSYMVDEADSDVEIVDEVIYNRGGVEIQEISHSVGYRDEDLDQPVASTSKGPVDSQVVVDLVSSDDEEELLNEFEKRIWSKFTPSCKVICKVPPAALIPVNTPDVDKVYEFDLTDKSDVSDLELECLVDEFSLSDDDRGRCSTLTKSWKEWRQNMFQEARDVMNDSLLAGSESINGETASEKLGLWKKRKYEKRLADTILNSVVFEMYASNGDQGFSRLRAAELRPSYYVSIAKQDESIPDFEMFESSYNEVPVLIAVVCDTGDGEVVFMTADKSPMNSLF